MAGKKRGVTEVLHNAVVMLWVVFSVVICGTLCIIVCPFSARASRVVGLWWMRSFLWITGVKVVVRGIEKLRNDKQYIFVANHQSHLDIPVLVGALHQQLSFIAKKELFAIPFFGWGMYALGHIWIDRSNARKAHASIHRALQRLRKDKISLVLFPEGTRSIDGKIGQFKQGSFLLVQQAGVEMVPLAIQNSSQLLPKHTMFVRSGTVSLTVCEPINFGESMNKADISEMVRGIIEEVISRGEA
ncbi:MAG: 1-acyl-sn-glycerol-3-phosphate acyltransferase [Chitinispirillaceae bacterium]|nr:1-acyl-sn-glycerol-3-phosphate acyltransferase [Chitinispirillaceae bacterium]